MATHRIDDLRRAARLIGSVVRALEAHTAPALSEAA
jgi:hypothetical protein